MNDNKPQQTWSVWIDENEKIISVKEISSGKEILFENKDIGIKAVIDLISNGYKIG